MKVSWGVAVGDPFDGFTLYGPFADEKAVLRFCQDRIYGRTWWMVKLHAPDEAPDPEVANPC